MSSPKIVVGMMSSCLGWERSGTKLHSSAALSTFGLECHILQGDVQSPARQAMGDHRKRHRLPPRHLTRSEVLPRPLRNAIMPPGNLVYNGAPAQADGAKTGRHIVGCPRLRLINCSNVSVPSYLLVDYVFWLTDLSRETRDRIESVIWWWWLPRTTSSFTCMPVTVFMGDTDGTVRGSTILRRPRC